jgi:hypothetical protein
LKDKGFVMDKVLGQSDPEAQGGSAAGSRIPESIKGDVSAEAKFLFADECHAPWRCNVPVAMA